MIETVEGVYWFSDYVADAYLVEVGGKLHLIDLPSPSIVDELRSRFGDVVVNVLFTHCHFDHIAGYTCMSRVMSSRFPFPGWFEGILSGRRPSCFPPFVKWVLGRQNLRFMGFRDFVLSFPSGATFFKAVPRPGSHSYIEDILFEVIRMPGHTPEGPDGTRKSYDELMAMGSPLFFPAMVILFF